MHNISSQRLPSAPHLLPGRPAAAAMMTLPATASRPFFSSRCVTAASSMFTAPNARSPAGCRSRTWEGGGRARSVPVPVKMPTVFAPTSQPPLTRARASFAAHQSYSYERSHDEQYQAWLNDLVTVVESNTWSAIPTMLRFPHADPEVVLSVAAGAGQAGLVETILRTSPDAVAPSGMAAAGAAVAAAARGHQHVLEVLLNFGLDADAVDEHDTSLLLAAAAAADNHPDESERCTSMLLEAGADANASRSRKGWKPLMAAAKIGNPRVIRLLLDAGADHEARYPNGKTPLYCAAEWGHLRAVEVLLEAGARPEMVADRLMTDWTKTADMRRGVLPAEVAARNGHLEVARLLSEATAANMNARQAGQVKVRFASCPLGVDVKGAEGMKLSERRGTPSNTIIKGEDSW